MVVKFDNFDIFEHFCTIMELFYRLQTQAGWKELTADRKEYRFQYCCYTCNMITVCAYTWPAFKILKTIKSNTFVFVLPPLPQVHAMHVLYATLE